MLPFAAAFAPLGEKKGKRQRGPKLSREDSGRLVVITEARQSPLYDHEYNTSGFHFWGQ